MYVPPREPADTSPIPAAQVQEGWLVTNARWIKALDRILIGLVVLYAGARKFFPGENVAYADIIEQSATGAWSEFWAGLARANPSLFVAVVGGFEIVVGALTLLGLLRKPAFLLGMGLGVWLWAVPEGFVGLWGTGRLESSAGIFLALCFLTLSILEATFGIDRYSLDRVISQVRERWLLYSDFYTLVNPLPPPEVSVAFLPILQRQRREREEKQAEAARSRAAARRGGPRRKT